MCVFLNIYNIWEMFRFQTYEMQNALLKMWFKWGVPNPEWNPGLPTHPSPTVSTLKEYSCIISIYIYYLHSYIKKKNWGHWVGDDCEVLCKFSQCHTGFLAALELKK